MEVTGDHGVDVVYEHVGGELFQHGLDSLAKDGRLVVCGAHAGEVVPFDVIPFFRRQLSVIGSFVFDRHEAETCFRLIARGTLKPQVAATFPLEQAKEAMDADGEPRLLRQDRAHPGRCRMKRIGVDVGGTFTDLIYVDDDAGVSGCTRCPPRRPTLPLDDARRARALARRRRPARARSSSSSTARPWRRTSSSSTTGPRSVSSRRGASGTSSTSRGTRSRSTGRTSRICPGSAIRSCGAGTASPSPSASRHRTARCWFPRRGRGARPVRRLKAAEVESVAICFLFSFLNPAHERRARRSYWRSFRRPSSPSRHEVLPQYREYEGFSTVCLNAYVGPKVSRYVKRLAGAMRERRLRRRAAPDDLGRRRDDRRQRGRAAGERSPLRARRGPHRRHLGGPNGGHPERHLPGRRRHLGRHRGAPSSEVRMRYTCSTRRSGRTTR